MKDKIFFNNKGAELSALGKYNDAEENFKKALELAPGDSFILYNIGFVLIKRGEKKKSIKWFDLALDNADSKSKATLALDCGLACFEAGLYKEAEKYYDSAFSFGKSFAAQKDVGAEYWNRLGVLSFVTEKYEKAKKCFEKVVSLQPDHADAWYNLADTYDTLGLKEKAAEARNRYNLLSFDNK